MCARCRRCHSYCWTNWKTGKGSETLLQEVLAAGDKIQHSNSGKNTIMEMEQTEVLIIIQ